jgi:hypothetical protein
LVALLDCNLFIFMVVDGGYSVSWSLFSTLEFKQGK